MADQFNTNKSSGNSPGMAFDFLVNSSHLAKDHSATHNSSGVAEGSLGALTGKLLARPEWISGHVRSSNQAQSVALSALD